MGVSGYIGIILDHDLWEDSESAFVRRRTIGSMIPERLIIV
jgi:hypothetical protein